MTSSRATVDAPAASTVDCISLLDTAELVVVGSVTATERCGVCNDTVVVVGSMSVIVLSIDSVVAELAVDKCEDCNGNNTVVGCDLKFLPIVVQADNCACLQVGLWLLTDTCKLSVVVGAGNVVCGGSE